MSISRQKFPRIYCKFESRGVDGEITKYRIQDLPDNKYTEALKLMIVDYLEDEPLNATKVHGNNEGLKELCGMWSEILKKRLSIACFKDDDSDKEIIGVNVLTINCDGDPDAGTLAKDPKLKDICDLMDMTFKEANIYGRYNVDKYLASFGICVNRKYRKCGIATELLKARVHLMKEIGVFVTATCFTVPGSQRAARKAGFECIYEISYDDLIKISPNFDFRNKLSNFYQIQALKI